ncbi:hypothetical protein niasHT_033940 [Heterodera trifolii]|uniref:Trehalase n=1 Tax=Heterodera trifolii TaxID=157864 RepID=A0ABD2I179_9BILA
MAQNFDRKHGSKVINFSPNDHVLLINYRNNKTEWLQGKVVEWLHNSPTYRVYVPVLRRVVHRHANQLRRRHLLEDEAEKEATQVLVYNYFGATGDIEFLKEIMPTLEKELNFWQTKRTVKFNVKGKKMMFYQYRADTKLPRHEAFCHDVKLVKNIVGPMEKAKIWNEIASASESGWDFSCNKAKSREYHTKYQLFLEDFKHLFYKKEHGIWYDFNLESGTSNEAYYGNAAMPLFTRCYDVSDLGTAERMFARLEWLDTATNNKLISHRLVCRQEWYSGAVFVRTREPSGPRGAWFVCKRVGHLAKNCLYADGQSEHGQPRGKGQWK